MKIEETRDLDRCRALRRKVFIEEQGVAEAEEWDGLDGQALHLLVWQDGTAIGTARILIKDGTGKIGRVCVLPEARGAGHGA
ncbi:MAG: GNAT family N-acetyltransferase, partial [Paracoccus sp. (in: a-proteobacteria)]